MNADDQDIEKATGKYLSVSFCANLRPIEMLNRKGRDEFS